MTEPDIVMHEVGHAFTEYNSRLEYVSQSGAIGESYSDIAGKNCQSFSHENLKSKTNLMNLYPSIFC